MATASHGSAIYPNSGPGQLAGKKAYGASTKRGIRSHNQGLPNTDQLAGINWTGLLKKLWPSKPSLELALATGCSQRHAERILAGSRGLSAEGLCALLRSASGLSVLRELMVGSNEPWWREAQRAMELADLEKRQAELRREIDTLARIR